MSGARILIFILDHKERIVRLVVLPIVILIIVGGWLWWSKIYEGPSTVFWGMLNNNLSTTSVTKEIAENGSGGSRVIENVQLELGSVNVAHAYSTISDPGTTVETEEINTPTTDYVRYTNIQTTQRATDGKLLNYTPVIGVWGETPTTANPTESLAQLFNQSLLGVVPLANLNPDQRHALIEEMHASDVYTVDYAKMTKQQVSGRLTYIYPVTIHPEAYIELLKSFASDTRLPSLASLNPSQYASSPPVEFAIAVDAASHDLAGIAYPGGGHQETYAGFGEQLNAPTIPSHTISETELQDQFQSIQ